VIRALSFSGISPDSPLTIDAIIAVVLLLFGWQATSGVAIVQKLLNA
jgi:hypothetical protein